MSHHLSLRSKMGRTSRLSFYRIARNGLCWALFLIGACFRVTIAYLPSCPSSRLSPSRQVLPFLSRSRLRPKSLLTSRNIEGRTGARRRGQQLSSSKIALSTVAAVNDTLSSASSVRDTGSSDALKSFWDELCSRFQGDFDNYAQVLEDRAQGKLPLEGGGHEHIHCLLIPVKIGNELGTGQGRLAAFYFDGNPSSIFRFRFYHIQEPVEGAKGEGTVDMVLYTLDPALEGKLRAVSTDPLQWPNLFETHVTQSGGSFKGCITELPGCDVRWSFTMDPVLHAYATARHRSSDDNEPGIHAIMVHGQALVDSQMVPGSKILIRDQLSLWRDEFWIHDRGFNPDNMEYIYGNQANVPYQLQRVSEVEKDDDDRNKTSQLERTVTKSDLKWTLGAAFRTPIEYEQKLDAMGGPSAKRAPAARLIKNATDEDSDTKIL